MDYKSIAEAGVSALTLQSEIGKKLVGPLLENLGLALGDLGDILRFYQTDNLSKIFTKWAEARNRKPLGEDELKRVLPLLRLASEQSDEDLQSRWAALLEHTATSEQGVLPSFGQTLSQLTSEEAKFLDRLSAYFSQLTDPSRVEMAKPVAQTLIAVYDPTIYSRANTLTEFNDVAAQQERRRESTQKGEQAKLLIQDLERLGIIEHSVKNQPDGFAKLPNSINGQPLPNPLAGANIPIHRSTGLPVAIYSLTPYGRNFIRAISLPLESRATSQTE